MQSLPSGQELLTGIKLFGPKPDVIGQGMILTSFLGCKGKETERPLSKQLKYIRVEIWDAEKAVFPLDFPLIRDQSGNGFG